MYVYSPPPPRLGQYYPPQFKGFGSLAGAVAFSKEELFDSADALRHLLPIVQNVSERDTINRYLNSAVAYAQAGALPLAADTLSRTLAAVQDTDAYRNIESSINEVASKSAFGHPQIAAAMGTLVGAISDGKLSNAEGKEVMTVTAAAIGTAACAASGYLTAVAPLCGLVVGAITGLIFDLLASEETAPVVQPQASAAYYETRDKAARQLGEVFWNFTRLFPFKDPNPFIQLSNGKWVQPASPGAILTGSEPQRSYPLKWRPGTHIVSAADADRAAVMFNQALIDAAGPPIKNQGRLVRVPLEWLEQNPNPGSIEFTLPTLSGALGVDTTKPTLHKRPFVFCRDANDPCVQPPNNKARWRELLRFVVAEPSPDGRPTAFTHAFVYALPFSGIATPFWVIGATRRFDAECKADTAYWDELQLSPWWDIATWKSETARGPLRESNLNGFAALARCGKPPWSAYIRVTSPIGIVEETKYEGGSQYFPSTAWATSTTGLNFGGDEAARQRYITAEAARRNPWVGLRHSWGVEQDQYGKIRETFVEFPSLGGMAGASGVAVYEKLVIDYYRDLVNAIALALSPGMGLARAEILRPFFDAQERERRDGLEQAAIVDCWKSAQTARWQGNAIHCVPVTADNLARLMEVLVRSSPAADPYRIVMDAYQRGEPTWKARLSPPEFQRLQQVSLLLRQRYMTPEQRASASRSGVAAALQSAAAGARYAAEARTKQIASCHQQGLAYGEVGAGKLGCRPPKDVHEQLRIYKGQCAEHKGTWGSFGGCYRDGKLMDMKTGEPASDASGATGSSPLLLVGGLAAIIAVGYFATRAQ